MNNLPLISVVVPLFNCEKEITRCLQSITNQSYKNLEIIIVNDSSTDNSKIIVENFIKLDNRIQLINLPQNKGAGNARNIGMNYAKGEFIAFVDSDDWLDTNFYSILYDNMKQYNSDIAIAGIINEYENRSKSETRYKYDYDNCIDNLFALTLLSRSYHQDIYITPIVNNKLYKKALFDNNGIKYEESSLYEDDLISFWLLYYSNKISITSRTNYHYFQRANSIIHTFNKKHIDDLFTYHKNLIDMIEVNKLDDIKEIAQKCFKKTLFAMMDRLVELVPNQEEQKQFVMLLLSKFKSATQILDIIDPIDFLNMKEFRY